MEAVRTASLDVIYVVEGGPVAACFDDNIGKQVVRIIAERRPMRAVFRDSALVSDLDRVNVGQILHELSPVTDVKAM